MQLYVYSQCQYIHCIYVSFQLTWQLPEDMENAIHPGSRCQSGLYRVSGVLHYLYMIQVHFFLLTEECMSLEVFIGAVLL